MKGPYVDQNGLRLYLILKELKHVYFCVLNFHLKPILSKTLRQKKSFKSKIKKMSHNVITETKTYYFEVNFV